MSAAVEVLATTIGTDSPQSRTYQSVSPQTANLQRWKEIRQSLTNWGAIIPENFKDELARLVEKSGIIEENIAAYVAMEGYGYELRPAFDHTSKDAWDKAHALLETERFFYGDESEITEDDVALYLATLEKKLRLQRSRIEQFVSNVARVDGRPVEIEEMRKLLRDDLERLGECYVEVLRDERGRPARLAYVPSVSIYRRHLDPKPVKVVVLERVSAVHVRHVEEWRHFRTFVQIDVFGKRGRYFKQYGDPRLLSSRTGRFYDDLESLALAENSGRMDGVLALVAGELIDRKCTNDPLSPYGRTRYLSHTPNAVGVRSADEVNLDYFENKSIPPLAVLVEGGELTESTVKRVEDIFKTTKGKDAFHRLIVLAARSAESAAPGRDVGAPPKIKLESLWNEQLKDALFIEYTERSEKRISAQYRVPPLLRGRADDYTRATAREAFNTFEQIVAQLERRVIDGIFNECLWELDITLWSYAAKGPEQVDLEAVTKLLDVGAKHGGLLPNDMRRIVGRYLKDGQLQSTIEERWAMFPLELSKAGQVSLVTAEQDGGTGEVDASTAQGQPAPSPASPTPSSPPPTQDDPTQDGNPTQGAPNSDTEGQG
jgi:PBSX family phage portal protein